MSGDGAGAEGSEHRWKVPAALDGERLDRAVAIVTGLSRREVNEVLAAGRVRLGRRVVTSRSRKVHEGETVGIDGPVGPPDDGSLLPEPGVDVPVVHEDPDVVVVDKPAGMVVHPGAGHRSGTLAAGLLARYPELGGMADEGQADRPGIVHRLDKGTSGLLVVARSALARRSLVSQLAQRSVGREYIALVVGRMDSDAGMVDAPLGRSDSDPTRIRVQAGGRPARTHYNVEGRYSEPGEATLLACRLETGRTHQIRVHLASIGHPVAGDERYGNRNRSAIDALMAPGRLFLHAATLEFDHPVSGQRLRFRAELPEDLRQVLGRLHPETAAPGR